jgi:ubiquinone biosynthesis accessory factor UbiJ
MATQSPFSLLEGFLQKLPLPAVQPPAWVVDEVQRRVVLLLNHILMQEGEAMARLVRQKNRVVQMHWRAFSIKLVATPAGLLDRAADDAKPDLVLALIEASPLALAQSALRGDKPAVRIEGDVQLAAEVNWLTDHVRWDIEEDLARVMGDAPAHTLSQAARSAAQALRQFLSNSRAAGSSGQTA